MTGFSGRAHVDTPSCFQDNPADCARFAMRTRTRELAGTASASAAPQSFAVIAGKESPSLTQCAKKAMW